MCVYIWSCLSPQRLTLEGIYVAIVLILPLEQDPHYWCSVALTGIKYMGHGHLWNCRFRIIKDIWELFNVAILMYFCQSNNYLILPTSSIPLLYFILLPPTGLYSCQDIICSGVPLLTFRILQSMVLLVLLTTQYLTLRIPLIIQSDDSLTPDVHQA